MRQVEVLQRGVRVFWCGLYCQAGGAGNELSEMLRRAKRECVHTRGR